MDSSLKNQAYTVIKQKILSCEYAPGSELNEAVLCGQLSISRTPVRDALSRLEHDHLLRIVSKKGIIIESITVEDIGNYFEVLLCLVQTAVLDSGKNIKDSDLITFRQFFSDMTHMEDPYEFCSTLSRVFSLLIAAIGNPYYLQMHEQTGNMERRLLSLLRLQLHPKQMAAFPALCIDFIDECISGNYAKAAECAKKIIRLYQEVLTLSFLESCGKEKA